MGCSSSDNETSTSSVWLETYQKSYEQAKDKSTLNAFITLNSNAGHGTQIEGRLTGLTLAVKDNIHVAGLPNSAGTVALEGFVPALDAPIIARLKAEGAIILGKANMHELAFGITSNNAHFGPVKNPYDMTRFAGGSSGGSAAAVAAGIVPAAIGTDTGGSIRIPAALTGIIGFRPSPGRYPTDGITPISHTRDVPGPLARNMRHITLLDSVMSAQPEVTQSVDTSGLRLGVARDPFYENLNPALAEMTEIALMRLRSAGVTLVEIDMPELMPLNAKIGFPIALYEGVVGLEAYLETYVPEVSFFDVAKHTKSSDVQALFAGMAQDKDQDGRPDGVMPKVTYDLAMTEYRPKLIRLYNEIFAAHNLDALVFPTTILPAGKIEGTIETVMHNGQLLPTFPTYIRNAGPGSNAGLPGISLPIGLTNSDLADGGLPVGLELDGLPGEDVKLLAIALAIEPIFGTMTPP